MLPPKRERFCREYMIDLNGTQAAIRSGYSEKTAQEQSSFLLSNIMVKARIAELQEKVEKKLEISVENVLQILMNIANVDTTKAYHPDGSPRNIHDIPKEVVKGLSTVAGNKKYTVNSSDRIKAADLLMKYLGDRPKEPDSKQPTEMQFVMNVKDSDGVEYDKPRKPD